MKLWLKKGCVGCGGALVLIAMLAGILALAAWMQTRGERPTDSELTRTLDAAVLEPATELPAPVVLELDSAWARVIVEPAEPGEPLGISANYDPRRYELIVSPAEFLNPGDLLSVSFAPRGSRMMAAVRSVVGGALPRLTVRLPATSPVALRAKLTGGFGLLDLGGLRLTQVDLEIDRSLTQVQFREPTLHPVDRMDLFCRGGNMVLYNLGHASPRQLSIHQGLGPGFFDLSGDWRADAEVEVSVAFGTGHLRIPDAVGVQGLEGRFSRYNHPPPSSGTEIGPPTLEMRVHFDAGEIKITRIPE